MFTSVKSVLIVVGLVLLILALIHYFINGSVQTKNYSKNISYNGTELNCGEICRPIVGLPKISYILFTSSSKGQKITKDLKSINSSKFNSNYPTRFIAHDWNDTPSDPVNTLITNAFLQKGQFNIFVVDWTHCAKDNTYFQARCCVKHVGKQIAEFIDLLYTDFNLKLKQTNLIGHGLGAHCMGNAGKNVKNGKIHTIIGLDPSKSCFIIDKNDDILTKYDAEYVETIQTNGELLGFYMPLGQASFYPNWGKTQLHCNPLQLHECSHDRAFEYYAEAITETSFVPIKCESFEALQDGICNMTVEDGVTMGNPDNYGKAKGIYFLETVEKLKSWFI